MMLDIIIGLILSLLIAGIAYFKKSLDFSGLVASIVVGTIIYTFGQFLVWSALIVFFISSSILTKIHNLKDKEAINVQKKGRNALQVISNSLVATIFVILYYYLSYEILLYASIVAIASSNADTWASEVGILSKGNTYSIVTFKTIPKGTSGGVSYLGLLASLLGALLISMVFIIVYGAQFHFKLPHIIVQLSIITTGGFVGSIVDSYLGMLVQAKYQGTQTGNIYEINKTDLETTTLISGFRLINNDMVNLLSGLIVSVIIVLLFL